MTRAEICVTLATTPAEVCKHDTVNTAPEDMKAHLYAGGIVGMGSPLYTTRRDVPTSAWNAALNLLFPVGTQSCWFSNVTGYVVPYACQSSMYLDRRRAAMTRRLFLRNDASVAGGGLV